MHPLERVTPCLAEELRSCLRILGLDALRRGDEGGQGPHLRCVAEQPPLKLGTSSEVSGSHRCWALGWAVGTPLGFPRRLRCLPGALLPSGPAGAILKRSAEPGGPGSSGGMPWFQPHLFSFPI